MRNFFAASVFVMMLSSAFSTSAASGTELSSQISKDCKIISQDKWYGFNRTKFNFSGFVAWVVEPDVKPLEGRPWTWTMQWAEAYVKRTGVPAALAKGYHHVTIELFDTRMNDEGVKTAAAFQKYLVEKLSFAPKANLIGMSWGGFFSVRYASAHPENVRRIYLDAPLLSFEDFSPSKAPSEAARIIGPWAKQTPHNGNWAEDSRMPVNLFRNIAEAEIPVLLLYGGQDQSVNPRKNSLVFAERFKNAGGKITVENRWAYGHHPHGVEIDETGKILKFFE